MSLKVLVGLWTVPLERRSLLNFEELEGAGLHRLKRGFLTGSDENGQLLIELDPQLQVMLESSEEIRCLGQEFPWRESRMSR